MTEAYRGLACYQDREEDRQLFFGRSTEAQSLLSRILSSSLSLLFSEPGLGKTSLINAGLLEPLREKGFFPVVIRLTAGDLGVAQSVYRSVREAAQHQSMTAEVPEAATTLWEYFYRAKFSAKADGKDAKPRRLVLIFDQFEELFTTIGRDPEHGRVWKDGFVQELADLVRGRVPEPVLARMTAILESEDEKNEEWDQAMALVYKGGALDVKVLLSIQEDFLPSLADLKPFIPAVLDNSMRLEPLTIAEAREAITLPGQQAVLGLDKFTVDPEVVEAILTFCRTTTVLGRQVLGDSIEPFQLQIICQNLDGRRRRRKGKSISRADLGGKPGIPRLIDRYYRRLVAELPRLRPLWSARGWYRPSFRNLILVHRPRAAAVKLCEHGLVTPTGGRNSMAASVIVRKYGVSEKDLNLLAASRLVDSDSRLGSRFYQLSHDTLARSVRRVMWRRRGWRTLATLGVIGLFLIYPRIRDYRVARPYLRTLADTSATYQARRGALDTLSERGFGKLKARTLQGLDLNRLSLKDIDFSGSNLAGASLEGLSCEHCSFRHAQLDSARFSEADLSEADFRLASLRGAVLAGANLARAQLDSADLSDADLEEADLRGVTVEGTQLERTAWWLAFGWSPDQIESLRSRWPPQRFEVTPRFRARLAELAEALQTTDNQGKAIALNERAWFRATSGVQLDSARADIDYALKRLDGLDASMRAILLPHFLDTRGFIMLQKGVYDSAAHDLSKALETLGDRDRESEISLKGPATYRLALAQCGLSLGDSTKRGSADSLLSEASSLRYRPSYEMVLAPRGSLRCGDDGKLRASIYKRRK